MNIAIYVKATLAIQYTVSAPAPDLMDYETERLGAAVIQDHWASDGSPAWVQIEGEGGGVALSAGPQPSPSHVWDWSGKAWVIDLAAATSAMWIAALRQRDAQEFGPFEWQGHTFDGDEASQRRLSMAAQGATLALSAGAAWSIPWTLADNSVIELSAAEMVGVMQALGENIQAAHAIARAKRVLIEAATTIEELDAIEP